MFGVRRRFAFGASDTCGYILCMSRPALSALRALEIIDLMAGLPAQAFTLSEIAQLTGTNVASCHAILGVLMSRGYLLRHPVHKAYRLAPSIVAIGEAAAAHDHLLASARATAGMMAEHTGLETTLSARAGDDMIGVAHFGRSALNGATLRVGQRVPMRPPIGSPFLAWAAPEDAERWIAPEGDATPPTLRIAHEAALALVRERGFLITLDSPAHSAFTRQIERTSSSEAGQIHKLSGLLAELDNGLYQPDRIEARQAYPAKLMSAPIFDAQGKVLYAININFPAGMRSGSELLALADQLLGACAASMRANSIDPAPGWPHEKAAAR
jgi:DNA-binding IclR family transcriptional regulator